MAPFRPQGFDGGRKGGGIEGARPRVRLFFSTADEQEYSLMKKIRPLINTHER